MASHLKVVVLEDARVFGINQVIEGQIVPLQNLLVEKTQRRYAHLDAACCALLFVEQIELISRYLLGAKLFWRLAEILGELLDSMDITAGSVLGMLRRWSSSNIR